MENGTNENKVQENEVQKKDEVRDIPVPSIIVEEIANLCEVEDSLIRRKAQKIQFPLTEEDRRDLVKLVMRYNNVEHIAGLSAPQLGINKRAFIFAVPETPGVEQTFPKSVWINPTYRNASGATLDEDYEICFSLKSDKTYLAGPVYRFNRINYRANDIEGRILEGEARGFAARVIQHEIDHLDGKLFVDYVQPERLLPLSDYIDRLGAGTLDQMQTGIVPETYA